MVKNHRSEETMSAVQIDEPANMLRHTIHNVNEGAVSAARFGFNSGHNYLDPLTKKYGDAL